MGQEEDMMSVWELDGDGEDDGMTMEMMTDVGDGDVDEEVRFSILLPPSLLFS